MKHLQLYEPRSGKFVRQVQGGVTFTYDLHLCHSRDHRKGPTGKRNEETFLHHDFSFIVP